MEVTTLMDRTFPIQAKDPSQVGSARRQAVAMASALGFDETRQGELGIVVTEAARNIAAHADTGEVVLSPWSLDGKAGIDVFALDRGQGIADLSKAIEDGYSTSGTPGQGLGAIRRLSALFQVYSGANRGTALFARMLRDPIKLHADSNVLQGSISVAVAGEPVCGDAWCSRITPERSIYMMADGLGHGPLAANAALEAVRAFEQAPEGPPEQILREIHGALAKTRGAAVSVAEILHSKGVVNYAGAGNIVAAVCSDGHSRSMVSLNGTVGHSVAKFQSFSYPWQPASLLIMHSDGLGSRWTLDLYPGLAQRHPALIAAVLYRDFSRRRDDATIVVTRRQPG